jgi:hypothetical protein
LAASELTEAHLVPSATPNTVPYLLLAGAVHFRSIFQAEWLDYNPHKIRLATRLLNLLLWQVSNLLPRVALYKDPGGIVRVRAEGDNSLPVLLCPITARGRGEKMLVHAGFDIEGFDKRGNQKFVLDISHINEAAAGRVNVPAQRLKGMLAAVEMLRYFQRGRHR